MCLHAKIVFKKNNNNILSKIYRTISLKYLLVFCLLSRKYEKLSKYCIADIFLISQKKATREPRKCSTRQRTYNLIIFFLFTLCSWYCHNIIDNWNYNFLKLLWENCQIFIFPVSSCPTIISREHLLICKYCILLFFNFNFMRYFGCSVDRPDIMSAFKNVLTLKQCCCLVFPYLFKN
jgi:hypothetical protein